VPATKVRRVQRAEVITLLLVRSDRFDAGRAG
jgi:hypothetical protein